MTPFSSVRCRVYHDSCFQLVVLHAPLTRASPSEASSHLHFRSSPMRATSKLRGWCPRPLDDGTKLEIVPLTSGFCSLEYTATTNSPQGGASDAVHDGTARHRDLRKRQRRQPGSSRN